MAGLGTVRYISNSKLRVILSPTSITCFLVIVSPRYNRVSGWEIIAVAFKAQKRVLLPPLMKCEPKMSPRNSTQNLLAKIAKIIKHTVSTVNVIRFYFYPPSSQVKTLQQPSSHSQQLSRGRFRLELSQTRLRPPRKDFSFRAHENLPPPRSPSPPSQPSGCWESGCTR